MKLTRPTDFDLLEALSDGRADVARNLARRIDRDRAYINTRLPQLADYDLLERVGPDSTSGLYRITPAGIGALRLRNRYGHVDDFEAHVRDKTESILIRPPEVVDQSD